MKKRIMTAAIGLPLLLQIITASAQEWVFLFFCTIAFLTALEIMRLFVGKSRNSDSVQSPAVFLGFSSRDILLATLAILIFVCEVAGRKAFERYTVFNACMALILVISVLPSASIEDRVVRVQSMSVALLYACLPWFALWELYQLADHGVYVIALLAIAWAGDTAAFFVGKTWGKAKLAPLVSPHKTWLGAGAGFLASLAAAFMVLAFFHRPLEAWPKIAILGAVTALTGQAGDHFKSVFKRYAKVKDAGSILPGHGGLLDRIDSVLLAAPVFHFAVVGLHIQLVPS